MSRKAKSTERRRREASSVANEVSSSSPSDPPWTRSWRGAALLWAGWLLPQFFLFGPALFGESVYAPVDLLAIPGVYLPRAPEYQRVVPHDGDLMDLVLIAPAFREFSAREFRAGRLPLWRPGNFAGAPFATWPKYSPFEIPYYFAPGPRSLAWMHLAQMLCLGGGMWCYLRRSVGLGYWPAAFASWCAPFTGFISLWQGYPVVAPVCWLPWSLLAIDAALSQPWGRGAGVAVVTGLLLLCGQSDVGGLVLLTTGLYALWRLAPLCFDTPGTAQPPRPELSIPDVTRRWALTVSAASSLVVAWGLGFALAAPFLLPMLEYSRTGARMQARAEGFEERPPEGIGALAAVPLPDFYGSSRRGSLRIAPGNRLESSSGAYGGLLALFWLAPLAWTSRRYRRETIFFTALALGGLSWSVNCPGVTQILRCPPLNMLSYNRWVFATSTSLLVLAAIGLEQLRSGAMQFRRWFLVPILLAAGFGLLCLALLISPPEPIRTQLEPLIRSGRLGNLTLDDAHEIRRSFRINDAVGCGLALAAVAAWLGTSVSAGWSRGLRFAAIALLPFELLWFAGHEKRTADRALYFPRIPILEQLQQLPPGRLWGLQALPPNLNESHGLEDIRGYDAVDPAPFVRLFDLARDTRVPPRPYAITYTALPRMLPAEDEVRLHPIADLLNVRYLVTRTPPREGTPIRLHQQDYWIIENSRALPRAFVPRRVQVVANEEEALEVLREERFDPLGLALSTDPLTFPGECRGEATVTYESPGRVRIDARLDSDGLVVLSDLWDAGWQGALDGASVPIHRVNVALRGVRVPAGAHSIVMTYAPASVTRGFWLAGAAAVLIAAWGIAIALRRRSKKMSGFAVTAS